MAKAKLRSSPDAAHAVSANSNSQSSEQLRNRENQRRLRMRRKEYFEELEKRVRQVERDGVRATQEVQRAARLVVEENRLLRLLLQRCGISCGKVDELLGKAGVNAEASRDYHGGHGVIDDLLNVDVHPLPTLAAGCGNAAICAPLVNTGTSGVATIVSREHTEAVAVVTRDEPCTSPAEASVGNKLAIATSVLTPSSQKSKCDEMDCEEAARLITSLRGGSHFEDVWQELGCSEDNRISVENATVMNLAG